MKPSRILSVICVITVLASLSGCCGKTAKDEGRAKYIFLFIGDGMGNSHVAATESYLSYKEGKLGGEQLRFTQFPYLGLASTYSANASITCSSAAGTAIACGAKTNNGMVGMDPEGNHLKSMAFDLKEDGYKIGIMSSVPINHATPASFYAHNRQRSAHYQLSQEIPASGFEFFGGAGFLDYKGKDGKAEATDTYLEKNGYKVCYGADEFNATADGCEKIVFCQPSDRHSDAEQYTTDGKEESDASLAEIVEMAVGFLGDNDPFFIMCEGGAIDWEAHGNNTMGTIRETIEFDKAIEVAYQFYLAHPDETLIVVTADHETGGIALGANGGGSVIDWARLEAAEAETRELNAKCSIGWTTGGHTGAPVPTYAIGKGAEKFCGRYDNTDIKGKILGE
ncbi:MAG: alkaline phosphatase [Bacteroidales bacterium]|nr:alkaline phosphatase [Bacteroidales bacterium]